MGTPTNLKQLKALEAEIATKNRKEADQLVDELATVISRNNHLAAQIAGRWAKAHGYVFYPKAKADAEALRKYPDGARQSAKVRA